MQIKNFKVMLPIEYIPPAKNTSPNSFLVEVTTLTLPQIIKDPV